MKTHLFFLILFFLPLGLIAQNNIVNYQYWLDSDFGSSQEIAVSPIAELHLQTNLDLGTLSPGFHTFHIRFQDQNQYYSPVSSQLIFSRGIQRQISTCEYWFDNDVTNRNTITVSPQNQVQLLTQFDCSALQNGMHTIHIRFMDDGNYWSPVVSRFFEKSSNGGTSLLPAISAYEYWFDQQSSNRTMVSVSPQQQLYLQSSIPVTGLSNGMHLVHLRFQDEGGNWSSVISRFFESATNGSSSVNLVTAYRYWIDSMPQNMNQEAISTPATQIQLNRSISMVDIPKGEHYFHIQFKDTAGLWSSVLTDTVTKNALPVARFTYESTYNDCDSTVIQFTDQSVDADTYAWDFGDGQNSAASNPVHTYYTSGLKTISLTVTELSSGLDSIITLQVDVSGTTSASLDLTACFQQTSPSGKYVWTQSGQYFDTIANHYGCDSLLTVNLIIDTVDIGVTENNSTLTADGGDSWQWIDCGNGSVPISGATGQSFQPASNGQYAVIVNQGNCSDTSICIVIDQLKTNSLFLSYGVQIFPNPTSGSFQVFSATAFQQVHIRIFDMTGRLILERFQSETNLFQLDLSPFDSGQYMLELDAGQQIGRFPIRKL